LRRSDFLLYLVSRFCAASAMTMLRAAVAWHVFDLSRSAFHLGLIGLVQFLPQLGLTLVGGVAADTYERRRIMMAAQSVSLAASILLVLATSGGGASLGLLYLAVTVVAAAGAFDNPARAAFLPTIVSREFFPRAVTIGSTNQALAFATGPALGGIVIASSGIAAAYAVCAVLVAASVLCLAFIARRPLVGARGQISWHAVKEGVAFVRSRQVLLGCMTLDMFAVIFGGATALLPMYANDILRVGPRGYGLLSSALEIGALLSSVVLIFAPPIRRAGRALLIAVGVFGVATIVFGLSRSFPLSLAAYMIAGAADQVSVVMRHTAVQLTTPDALRGRVSAVNFIFIGASNQLGAVESGFVAALTSATFAVVSGGIGCLVALAVVAMRMPELRRYEVGGHRKEAPALETTSAGRSAGAAEPEPPAA
jgi:MFS family permease